MRTLRLLALLSVPTWEAGNALSAQYSSWADLRNARVQSPALANTISVPELVAWQKVKSAWRAFEKQQDAEYRGDR